MAALIVDNSFWQIFPEAKIYYLVVHNINNQSDDSVSYHTMLDIATQKAQKFLQELDFKENPLISSGRLAFTKFKKKKGARSSIEALLKRVSKGAQLHSINPLVDLYNSISLEYGAPFGGEDLDSIKGTMHLGTANGGEVFFPLGANKNELALPNELIYYDTVGAICRSLNWRDAQRTMLTEKTKNAILITEGITSEQQTNSLVAIKELQKRIAKQLCVPSTLRIINVK
ncbi:B3/B4 domain-containing protein [Lentilactobacillus kisonensis]|uniref:B3/4 domain protein n=1 Tax=Lentilactobacillus kisonensis F0435 TaxID=797516 RepID=H1LKE0_9LACO|nr:phenylalanine--tRNA ligase beta subunit-related protein [Lentilactobacillus kisonensis]EHO47283.1 b3/4 domain protein [Lentilactobacillus kisonensis F0435]